MTPYIRDFDLRVSTKAGRYVKVKVKEHVKEDEETSGSEREKYNYAGAFKGID